MRIKDFIKFDTSVALVFKINSLMLNEAWPMVKVIFKLFVFLLCPFRGHMNSPIQNKFWIMVKTLSKFSVFLVWFFFSMNSLMLGKRSMIIKTFVTYTTFVRFHSNRNTLISSNFWGAIKGIAHSQHIIIQLSSSISLMVTRT